MHILMQKHFQLDDGLMEWDQNDLNRQEPVVSSALWHHCWTGFVTFVDAPISSYNNVPTNQTTKLPYGHIS